MPVIDGWSIINSGKLHSTAELIQAGRDALIMIEEGKI